MDDRVTKISPELSERPDCSPNGLLVSVIVVNRNLGRFLRQAVLSVFAQTYDNFECIIVDDCSTDYSRTTIKELKAQFPNLTCILRDSNDGQVRAAMDGMKVASGDLIHFLDADDYLTETFLSVHVAVHLALSATVGFTCSNMFKLYFDRVAAWSVPAIETLRGDAPLAPCLDIPPAFLERYSLPWNLTEKVSLVSESATNWPWAATSAMVFRRRAVQLLDGIETLPNARTSLDAYLCLLINSIAGSAVIDLPLAFYRQHDSNAHLTEAPLSGLCDYDRVVRKKKDFNIIENILIHFDNKRHLLSKALPWPAKLEEIENTIAAHYAFCLSDAPTDSRIRHVKTRNYGPLVSFVIVNHNYGRFLGQCINSILTQSYENIQCIIVDNGSTDDSLAVIDRLQSEHANIVLIENSSNVGQLAACRQGFAQSSGSFVTFVDADDYYLPDFVASHIRVHLTIPHRVGFTSSDMVQLVGSDIVAGAYFRRTRAYAKCTWDIKLNDPSALQKTMNTKLWTSGVDGLAVRMVKTSCTHWVWSPTSANMFRRDAAALLLNNEHVDVLRVGADTYLNYGINSLCGSAIFKPAQAVYRVHGDNNFSSGAILIGQKSYRNGTDPSAVGALFALEHILRHFPFFVERSDTIIGFFLALKTLKKISLKKGFRLGDWILAPIKAYFEWGSRVARSKYLKDRAIVDYLKIKP